MSGLLQRLAAQATGQAGRGVHSLARIPYVAPLDLAESVQAQDVPAPRSEPSRPAADETRPSRPAFDPRPSPLAERSAAVSPEPSPLMPSVDPEHRSPSTTEHAAPAHIRANSIPGGPPDAHAEPPQRSSESALPSPVLAARADEPGQRPKPAPRSMDQAERVFAAPICVIPEPLLGPLSPGHYQRSAVRPYSMAEPSEIRTRGEPESTEVQVHIGRIEVTAVHDAAPERPKRPPARGPMSLDDYLTRRKEERR